MYGVWRPRFSLWPIFVVRVPWWLALWVWLLLGTLWLCWIVLVGVYWLFVGMFLLVRSAIRDTVRLRRQAEARRVLRESQRAATAAATGTTTVPDSGKPQAYWSNRR